jgi:hypothetical protein
MKIFFVGSDRQSRPSRREGYCWGLHLREGLAEGQPAHSFFLLYRKVPPPTIEGAEWLDKRARDHA